MQHEALFKISKLLDQFKEGLKKAKLLKLIQNFPEQFTPLFTFTGSIPADSVINALYSRENEDTVTLAFLHRYIRGLSEKGIIIYVKH